MPKADCDLHFAMFFNAVEEFVYLSAGLLPVQSFLEVLVHKILSEILSIILGNLTSHFESLHYWYVVFIPVIGGHGNPLQYSYLKNGQRSLAGYSPWGHKESIGLKWLSIHMHTCDRGRKYQFDISTWVLSSPHLKYINKKWYINENSSHWLPSGDYTYLLHIKFLG